MVGKVARVGIWFLMITFGAAFGFTVMGRIALLAARAAKRSAGDKERGA